MTLKICTYCDSYIKGWKCDFKDKCYLYALYKQNKKLKEENKLLKRKIDELETDLSWGTGDKIGDVHEMGCC